MSAVKNVQGSYKIQHAVKSDRNKLVVVILIYQKRKQFSVPSFELELKVNHYLQILFNLPKEDSFPIR